jgi:2,4-dichlorophenol 6-monooxygenase
MMTAQVAEQYGSGRIFLIGDSAHRFPPTGGMGLNTGVQDAHNLAWKIAAVEGEWGTESLLETYESERRPVARHNADQSLANALRLFEVPQALGVTDRSKESNARMQAVLADPGGRRRVAAAIENQAEHFDMLGLQLGFSYDVGALADDGTAKPVVAQNPVREVVPSSRPGARLPHGWVERAGQRLSTLDLVQPDRFTLLIDSHGDAWEQASRHLGVPIEVVRFGADVVDLDGWWTSVARMSPGGALLVRPDQHVAFRSTGALGEARRTLREAVARILGTSR